MRAPFQLTLIALLARRAQRLGRRPPRSPSSRPARCGRWRCRRTATRLFAVNTPDNRLEIFDVAAGG